MRHPIIKLAAAAVIAGSALGFAPAETAPLPALATAAKCSAVETVGYYRHRGSRYSDGSSYNRYLRYNAKRHYGYGYGYRYRPSYYRGYGCPYCYRGYW
ncbi:MAG: hypothetical protein ACREDO_10940 [Methyloceanibacter sp.]